ncbi:MAG: class I SAM-dependent methyltransferase [Anaerolineae bacterium]
MDEIDRLALPFDQYQRYSAAAQIAELLRQHLGRSSLQVLDVGGVYCTRWGQTILPLAHFLPHDQIVAADLLAEPLPQYLVASGQALPFGHIFDLVVTCDTLEHVPPAGRPTFVEELLRVTRHVLVLIAPFGDDATCLAEHLLAEYMAAKGIRHVQLQEHAALGLPDADELRNHLASLGLAWLDLPDGYLHHWLAMMMVKHTPGYSLDFHLDLDRYYNRHFSPHDRREPSYRRVFVVTRPDSEALLPAVSRAWDGTKPEAQQPDLLPKLLHHLNQHQGEGLHSRLAALEAENAGLRQELEAYEKGRFISFMRWLHQERARWLRGPTR